MNNRLPALIALIVLMAASPLSAEGETPQSTATAPARQNAGRIEPGKVLKIAVYREPDLSGDFRVDTNGYIAYPLIGSIPVADRSNAEITAEIALALKKFLINPQVTVTIEDSAAAARAAAEKAGVKPPPITITVLGEVRTPGTVEYGDEMTLTKLLAKTGGFTPTAERAKVKLIRVVDGKQKVGHFDMNAIENGDTPDEPILPGDKVVVPKEEKDVNTAAILGQVRSAGMYEVTPGMTLMRLIAKAGGFTPLAATSKVRVVREAGAEKKVYVYNATTIINGQGDDPEVKAGDMVFVPETFF